MEKTRERGVVFVAAAIILALTAGMVVANYVSSMEEDLGAKIKVVVAKVDIPERTLITVDMVELKEIPRRYALDSYLLDTKDVQSDMVALVNIAQGDILQYNMIDRNAGLGPGMRAVSVDVNRVQSVGGSIRPGNQVDIIASYEDDQGGKRVLKTVLLFQDVLVLGVSTLNASPPSPTTEELAQTGSQAGETNATPTPIPQTLPAARFSPSGQLLSEATVTLALPVEDAMKLIYMNNFGRDVRFVIRRLDEKDMPQLQPVTVDSFK
jgi:Flp pilus assembly protein CpaB